ncbi:MAG TPA: hypothetical protein PKE50_04780, partial [Rhodocyclaceae bacterium]|nr:hypothetical protein [Rhodocyclaceae bacterium]
FGKQPSVSGYSPAVGGAIGLSGAEVMAFRHKPLFPWESGVDALSKVRIQPMRALTHRTTALRNAARNEESP